MVKAYTPCPQKDATYTPVFLQSHFSLLLFIHIQKSETVLIYFLAITEHENNKSFPQKIHL